VNNGPGPVKANLGEQTSFVYDAELKRWVNKKVHFSFCFLFQVERSDSLLHPFQGRGIGTSPPRLRTSSSRCDRLPLSNKSFQLPSSLPIRDATSRSNQQPRGSPSARRRAPTTTPQSRGDDQRPSQRWAVPVGVSRVGIASSSSE
jgi:hypothetical protein